MSSSQVQGVVYQPQVSEKLRRGINCIVNAVSPTLGPFPRIVAISDLEDKVKSPELLDNGAIIARRILEIKDQDEDIGAMFARHVLWSVYEEIGDGTATTAVLLKSVFEQGLKYIASGGNPMVLRRNLEKGLTLVSKRLDDFSIALEGRDELIQLAESVCYDPSLSHALGEIMDTISEFGRLEVRTGNRRDLEQEYVEGVYWEQSGLLSMEWITDKSQLRAEMHDAALIISDLDVKDVNDIIPVLELAKREKINRLVIMASSMGGSVKALLTMINRKNDEMTVFGIKTPFSREIPRSEAMIDLARLTGGAPLLKAVGQKMAAVTTDMFGFSRIIWADKRRLGIIGGRGDPRLFRKHISDLKALYNKEDNLSRKMEIQHRIGRLIGGSATLRIGAATEMELKARKEIAERSIRTLRSGIRKGVLPGGGAALLMCRPIIQAELEQSETIDERAAYRILLHALEAPMRVIIHNAGIELGGIVAQVQKAGPGYGYDVRQNKVVLMREAGILDVADVVKNAWEKAVSSAALALTIDVMVHKLNPTQSLRP